MKKLLGKKRTIIFIGVLVFILLVSSFFVFYKQRLLFKLVGETSVNLNVYSTYNELGFIAKVGNKDLSSEVVIDSSKLNNSSVGTYEIVYKLNYNGKEYTLVRNIIVADNEAPSINLIGEEEVTIKIGNVYQEPGYTVVDNFDEDVKDKVQVINMVNIDIAGIYEVRYNVVDDSGNYSSVKRIVNVIPTYDYDTKDLLESNLVTNMSFIESGIHIEGYVKENNNNFSIKLCQENKSNCIDYEMNKSGEYYYFGDIKLSCLPKGIYYMWVSSIKDEKVINKQEMQYRISRSRFGDNLITFSYENDNIKLIVDDFSYEYDILIDPGHGGSDTGAYNSITNEKVFNLVQSMYEKKRYEEHGLKVLMLREDDTYGTVMGIDSWPAVRRKAYALGYYGVVSKITYSNHHNSSNDRSLTGWEIIVSANSTKKDLTDVYKIGELWSSNYNVLENHTRIYTRNYNSGVVFSKENFEQYYFTDYYAVIRLPYQLFNVRNVLFEGSYLSNIEDFNWYYYNDNWKKVSEDKIKVYVESLGVEYIKP